MCNSGFSGPSCTVFNGDVLTNPTSFTLTMPHNTVVDTARIDLLPNFASNAGPYSSSPLYAYMTSKWSTDNSTFTSNNRTAIPAGYVATPITFTLDMWYNASGVVVPLQELKIPMRLTIEWDRLTASTPWRLELFFYNTATKQWEQAIRNCVGASKREVLAQDPNQAQFGRKVVNSDGTISWDFYQATATYAILYASNSVTNIPGTAAYHLNPNAAIAVPAIANLTNNVQSGNARVPEITTGLTGILPLPPRIDPGNAPGEPARRPLDAIYNNSASLASVQSAIALLVAFLVCLLF
jgi:hypothetical protein